MTNLIFHLISMYIFVIVILLTETVFFRCNTRKYNIKTYTHIRLSLGKFSIWAGNIGGK